MSIVVVASKDKRLARRVKNDSNYASQTINKKAKCTP